MTPFHQDWLGTFSSPHPTLVLRPRDTATVSKILRYCNERSIGICPQGGNTGLVQGSVPLDREIVLSTNRMTSLTVDAAAATVVVEAGVVLETLQEKLRPYGLTTPIDIGSKGSCQMGGVVATNAGGIHMIRYGNLHGAVLDVEAVLADGSVVGGTRTLRKDNTGYDLKQLFIGSEGTLGIVTQVALACPPLPQSTKVCLLRCDTYEKVVELLGLARIHLGESLSAFEFLDSQVILPSFLSSLFFYLKHN
jgi:FAD/FMN-containing dehydrogenase